MALLPILFYGLVGLAVGSFLNVAIDRLPARYSLLHPASHCPGCGRRLTAGELVPVLSYLALRGRCRTCGQPIPVRVLLVELASGALFALLWWIYGPTLRLAVVTLYTCVLLVVLVIDLEHKLVLNVIILPAILFALASIPLARWMVPPPYPQVGLEGVRISLGPLTWSFPSFYLNSQLLGGITSFAVFLTVWLIAPLFIHMPEANPAVRRLGPKLYRSHPIRHGCPQPNTPDDHRRSRQRWTWVQTGQLLSFGVGPEAMGAGDVKLAIFTGLITAFPGCLVVVFGSFILGGVVGAILLIARLAGRKTAIPFAPFLVTATFLVMVLSDLLLFAYLR